MFWLQKCSICGAKEGACIQCARSSCFLAFHVTCGRKDKWLLPMKSAQGVEPGALTAYCEKHLPVCPRHSHTRSLPTEHSSRKNRQTFARRLCWPKRRRRRISTKTLSFPNPRAHTTRRTSRGRRWCLLSSLTESSNTSAGPRFERNRTLSRRCASTGVSNERPGEGLRC